MIAVFFCFRCVNSLNLLFFKRKKKAAPFECSLPIYINKV